MLFASCQKTESLTDFTEADAMLLGERLHQTIIENNLLEIIPEESNTAPYAYVDSRLQEILFSPEVVVGDDFVWKIVLFQDEDRRAFATPGGYIYISSGLIFFLDNEDQFAGLLAHLVAHILASHLSETLFFSYGVNNLKTISETNNTAELIKIVDDLDPLGSFLTISRANELEADTLTVKLLASSGQSCESSGLFMSRLLDIQPEQQASFIDAHRFETTRVGTIGAFADTNGCSDEVDGESTIRYRAFRNSIP